MLILAKTAMAILLGFVLSTFLGLIVIPLLRRMHIGQRVSLTLGERHLSKDGTPTFGGILFIVPTLMVILYLWITGSIDLCSNLVIILFVFLAYALLGFADDYMKVRFKNNAGLSILFKLFVQTLIALVFFYIFVRNGGETSIVISSIGLDVDLGWMYGLFILFLLVGSSNAVNITDGLDGLAGGLSLIAFAAYGVIAWNTTWISGYQEIAIFCFVLIGGLLGFLFFNTHPAKIFMGDTGSLALGGVLAAIAILTRHELSLAVIGGVFVIETLSSLIQMIAIIKFNKRIFKMAPLHHHFEQLGYSEMDIVKGFWAVGLILAMLMITYNVWI